MNAAVDMRKVDNLFDGINDGSNVRVCMRYFYTFYS